MKTWMKIIIGILCMIPVIIAALVEVGITEFLINVGLLFAILLAIFGLILIVDAIFDKWMEKQEAKWKNGID